MVRKKKKPWSPLPDGAGWLRVVFWGGVVLIGLAVCGIWDRTQWSPDQISEEHARFGWNAELAKVEAPQLAARMPAFAITGPDGEVLSGAGKNAELWKWAKLVNGGKHIPTWKQEDSDCCSMGYSNAVAYCQAFQIAKEGRNQTLKIPAPHFNYGCSRTLVGRGQLGRGGGSTGAWTVQAAIVYGVLPLDEAVKQGFPYSGRLASRWGQTGPPKSTRDFAQDFRLKTTAQVKTWVDLVDALVYGHPVTVASNVGFDGGHYQDIDGKRFLQPRGTWPHQMCFIGVEDRPGHTKGAYIINSWGADAHPKPLNDEPPGGFWVDQKTAVRMLQNGDSWAYSDFDGFKASDESGADWTEFKFEVADDPEEAEQVARAEQPEEKPFLWETRKMFSLNVLQATTIAGIWMSLIAYWAAHGFRLPKLSRTTTTMLIVFAITGVTIIADAGHRRRVQYQQTQMAEQRCNCPGGACAAGQCAVTGCVNGQCAVAAKAAAPVTPIPLVQVVHAKWCQYCPQQIAMLKAAEMAGQITKLEQIDSDEAGMPWWSDAGLPSTGWKDSNGKQWRIPGACSIEWLMSEYQRTEALAAKEPKSDPPPPRSQVASSDTFAAFEPMVPVVAESKPEINAWTSFEPHAKHLRTYADCYETERDFVLVIGSEHDALMTLEVTDKPVAFEEHHASIKRGTHHIYWQGDRLVIDALGEAVKTSKVTVRRPR